ncbi:unnamed protein product [Prorocentrum cordatum]|uniref:Uncharacterized protein n=1 Tax=Prorocentrum cordatum TaxID=2364126 RepID=A0ABN9PRI3_9DINO|nr:unnamed protein product [Polarella glacialis]
MHGRTGAPARVPPPRMPPPAPLPEAPDSPREDAEDSDPPDEPELDPAGPVRRFRLRCEGRWRVRDAPTLGSRVLGTMADGTVVVGSAVAGPGEGPAPPEAGDAAAFDALWVRALRFETREPAGVCGLGRDAACGREMYCLRRNALGMGLYEVGAEPLDGPLVMLPERLSVLLHADAREAREGRAGDVSLTWRLLEAAEHVGRLFDWTSGGPGGSAEQGGGGSGGRGPEEAFEARQRELLRRAAEALRRCTDRVLAAAGSGARPGADLTAGLPAEVRGRFARLRASLLAAERAAPVVTSHPARRRDRARPPSEEPRPEEGAPGEAEAASGCAAELRGFCRRCARIERSGGWPELLAEVRLEAIAFSQRSQGRGVAIQSRARDRAGAFGKYGSAGIVIELSDGGDLDLMELEGMGRPWRGPAEPAAAHSLKHLGRARAATDRGGDLTTTTPGLHATGTPPADPPAGPEAGLRPRLALVGRRQARLQSCGVLLASTAPSALYLQFLMWAWVLAPSEPQRPLRQNKLFEDFAKEAEAMDEATVRNEANAAVDFIGAKLEAKRPKAPEASAPEREQQEFTKLSQEFDLKLGQHAELQKKVAAAASKAALLEAAREPLMAKLDKAKGSTVTDHSIFYNHARKFEDSYFEDMDALGVLRPDVTTRGNVSACPVLRDCVPRQLQKGAAIAKEERKHLRLELLG